MAGIIVVFDFDRTMIDCDSDSWVVNELVATELFQSLRPAMSWNSLMVCAPISHHTTPVALFFITNHIQLSSQDMLLSFITLSGEDDEGAAFTREDN